MEGNHNQGLRARSSVGQTSSLFRDRKGGSEPGRAQHQEAGYVGNGYRGCGESGQPPRETQGPRAVSMTVSPGVTPRPALPATARFHARGPRCAAEDSQDLPQRLLVGRRLQFPKVTRERHLLRT